MKTIIIAGLLVVSAGAQAQYYGNDVGVQGYYRQDGGYVQPYVRSAPNGTRLDNYSTQGNINPYTGNRGYASPYGTRGLSTQYGAGAFGSRYDD